METLQTQAGGQLAVLEGYAKQGQMLLVGAAQNLVQFGRVLTEAKPMVPRGQFEGWVKDNFGMSERTAQQYMAVWKRFGQKEGFGNIQFANLSKMLALPEGKEEDFARDHDLEDMTAREVEKAVREAKAQAARELTKAVAETESRTRRETKAEYEDRLQDLEQARAEIAKMAAEQAKARTDTGQMERLQRERAQAQREAQAAREEVADLEEALKGQQAEYDRLQEELLNAQSRLARGDADRTVTESLSLQEFSQAVRGFLGTVAQVPYMGGYFAQETEGHREWETLIEAVADWAERARAATRTIEEV